MNKPFDLEAAKRGEKIKIRGAADEVHFVGVDTNGLPVVDVHGVLSRESPSYLRMAPKKEIRRYRRFEHVRDNGKIIIDVLNEGYDFFPTPSDLEKSKYFHKWIDLEWQSVEVEI